jgi:hypothetical protein
VSEYPKVIQAGGINVTVDSEADEARWRQTPALIDAQEPVPAPDPEPVIVSAPPVVPPTTAPKKKRTAKKK